MKKVSLFIVLSMFGLISLRAQSFMMNPYGRDNARLLNGKWNIIIDQFSGGEYRKFYENSKPQSDSQFFEYSFENAPRLDVPGDFNSQLPELKYYEGSIWYQRFFNFDLKDEKRVFVYFAGVNYEASVWLNGKEVGRHEGGFTPFQFEVTSLVKNGENDLVVKVNNNRRKDGIPAMNFDWWNYGGITRDVFLVETPVIYIKDYRFQLKEEKNNIITGYVQLDGVKQAQEVELSIPDLNITQKLQTDLNGRVSFEIKATLKLWEPASPELYSVKITSGNDEITDNIGFRTIETEGCDILLNGKSIFLKGINFHEEIPQRLGRAYSDADAAMILNEVKALGCNFVRTAHYPQNERIVRMAEKMGIMIWEEIPLWQAIDFENSVVLNKAQILLKEMIHRDKNRAGIIIWSVANETKPSEYRDQVLSDLINMSKELDDTRLIAAAFDNPRYNTQTSTFNIKDKITDIVDVVGVNKYLGWYMLWPVSPEKIDWNVAINKPLIMTEFGCEALYGQHGSSTAAYSWSEEYQEELYRKNLIMFKNIPNLRGTCPWVLFDFRSPNRYHPLNQGGWNRKGVVSDKGQRKKAWFVMKEYYKRITE